MAQQQTIAQEIVYTGIGLHSGLPVGLHIKPAPVNTGIVFVRSDLSGNPRVVANADNVTSTLRATTIGNDAIQFFTIEHLMSALTISGVDNCYVELDSEEPPVMDGSSILFWELIQKAGILSQEELRHEVVIDKVLRIDDRDKFVMVVPYDGFRVSFTSINEHPLVGTQYYDFKLQSVADYAEQIAPARTIAYEGEVEQLRKMGLGLGGNLDNVIVYSDNGWLNTLRYPDELVRHKILDLIGDMALAGRVRGHFIAVKSGHALNTKLAKQILDYDKEKRLNNEN